jgi:type I restriction enzyme R subunit
VLDYFDAYLIGLTATPNKQTFGFFNQNLVMEYGHEQAVADGVNVNYDVYRIRTEVTEAGSKVEAGYWVQVMDATPAAAATGSSTRISTTTPPNSTAACRRPTRSAPSCAPSATAGRPRCFPSARNCPRPWSSPRTTTTPKPSSKSSARNSAAATSSRRRSPTAAPATRPENLIRAFRSSYYPRIAVTVDMIATGTDIKPVEIVVFLRSVKSRSFFEQMKGRGVRIIERADLRAVNPGEHVVKDHFVIVDCRRRLRARQDRLAADGPRRRPCPSTSCCKPSALGNVEPEVLSSVAARLARLERDLSDADKAKSHRSQRRPRPQRASPATSSNALRFSPSPLRERAGVRGL